MKNLYFSFQLWLVTAFFLFPCVSFSQYPDSFQRLPQVNKKFQVVVQIVLDSLKVPAIDETTIRNTVAQVSDLFSPIGISFEVCDVRYISNYSYFNTDRNATSELYVKYGQFNRLNLFVVSSIRGGVIPVCGVASNGGVAGPKHTGITIAAAGCASLSTLGHELGHFFSLEHTFERQKFGAELADGSNCTTTGDLVCDTPADPYQEGDDLRFSIKNCLYIDARKDPKGNYYDPDLGNIMSYYPCSCNHFSRGQYEKMANYYLKNPILW